MRQAKHRRIRVLPHPESEKRKSGEKAKALSLDFKVLEEHWNTYELEDGTRVRVRVSIMRFDRALDFHTERPLYKANGEPQYGVEAGVEISFDYSEDSLRPEKEGK